MKDQCVTAESPTDSEAHRHENAAPDGPRNGALAFLHGRPDSALEKPDRQVSKYRVGEAGASKQGADKAAAGGMTLRSPEKPGKDGPGRDAPPHHSDVGLRASAAPADDFMDVPPNMVAALDLARQGLAVFPIRHRGQDKWTPITGWRDSASDEFARIVEWWTDWPDARVGLPTGKRNDLLALDLDTKNGKDGVAAMAAIGFPDIAVLSPVRVRTPSGGWHLLFRDDPDLRNSVSKIGPGVDVRAEGGFIVAPGSWKGDRRYQPDGAAVGSVALPSFPEKLAEMAERRALVSDAPAAPDSGEDDDEIPVIPQWDRMRRAGVALAEGGHLERHDPWFKMVAAIHHATGGSDKGLALADEISQRCGNYDGRELRDRWRSFGKGDGKPIRVDSLYGMANDLVPEWRAKAKAPAPRGASRLQLFTPGDCTDAPARGYVIKGLIAPRDVACIFGAPGGGKSTIAPHLGYQVARGETAFGLRTKPGPVLYVAAEDAHGMKNRVAALRRRDGDAASFYVVDGVTDLLGEDSPDLAALREIVDGKRPALIFLDTLAMSFRDLEENDAASMNKVVAIARSLTDHGAAVVLIHHGTKAEGSTPRGHSVLNGALDVAVQLLPPDTDGIIRGRLSKNRNGPCDLNIAFRVASEELGRDEDGDAITAAIVDELPAGTTPRAPRLPVGQREALAMLHELEATGQPVTEDAWRDACIDSRRVSQSEERDSRKKAFNRARTGLFRAGLILLSDDRVTVARQPDFEWPDDGEDDI